LSGKVIDKQYLPGPGGTLNKPKGLLVQGNRLWVSDIDVVWVFDLTTRRGKKAELPGSINPNGLYPARNGSLLMVGFLSPEQARGIYALGADGAIKEVAAGSATGPLARVREPSPGCDAGRRAVEQPHLLP
jgi:hypothetical protein